MYKADKIYNRLIDGTGVVYFSKLPIRLDTSENLSTESLECNIRNFSLPPFKADFAQSKVMHTAINIPNSTYNPYVGSTLNMSMILDEELDNYILLYRWLDMYNSTRYREDSNRPDGKWDSQRAFCPFIDILMFDNNKQPKNILRFKEVFITALGGINQSFSSTSEVAFDAAFLFNEFIIIKNPDDIQQVIGKYV